MREERMTVQAADVEVGDVLVYTADRRLTVQEVDPKRVYVYIDATEWDGADPYAVKYALDDDVEIIRQVPDEADAHAIARHRDLLARLRSMVDESADVRRLLVEQVRDSGPRYAVQWGGGPSVEAEVSGLWAGEVLDAVEGLRFDAAQPVVAKALESHRRGLMDVYGNESSPMWRAVEHHIHRARVRFVQTLEWYVDADETEDDR